MPMPSWKVVPGRAAARRALPRPPSKPSPAERSARANSGSAWNVQLPSCVFATPATSEHGHSAPSIPAIPLPPTTRSAPRNRPVDEDGRAGKTELAKSPGADAQPTEGHGSAILLDPGGTNEAVDRFNAAHAVVTSAAATPAAASAAPAVPTVPASTGAKRYHPRDRTPLTPKTRGLPTTAVRGGGAMRATVQAATGAGLIAVLFLIVRCGAKLDVTPPAPPPHATPIMAKPEYVEFELWSGTPSWERPQARALEIMGVGATGDSDDLSGTGQRTKDHNTNHRATGLSNEAIDNLDAILLSVLPGVEPGEVQLGIA